MQAKLLEVRDEATLIPMLCVDMNAGPFATGPEWHGERYLLRRMGYPNDGRPNILMTNANGDGHKASNDPFFWDRTSRTYKVAHEYIIKHWHELKSGDVVDVQFILGETTSPKKSERVEL